MCDPFENDLATPAEACREYARNYGSEHPERPWILTDFDTWERNPYYHGPEVPHPESEPEDECLPEMPTPDGGESQVSQP